MRAEAIDVGDLGWLTQDEHQRLARMASAERRRNFLAGHRLARDMAAQWHDIDVARVALDRMVDGRPCLLVDDAPSPLSVSLSHSDGWILAGLANTPVGVDVEVFRRPRDIEALARHAFAREEAERLALIDAEHRLGAFHEIWALKEARGKRTGEGILPGQSRRICAHPAPCSRSHATSWRLGEGGAVAIALGGGAVDVEDDGRLAAPRFWRFEAAR